MEELIATEQERVSLVHRLTGVGLAATLALLPFENQLPALVLPTLTLTGLELAWLAALALWLASLALDRRMPNIPRPLGAGLGLLLVAGLASACMAAGHNAAAMTFVGRSAAGWLLLIALVDVVRTERAAVRLAVALLVGAALAAVIGLVLLAAPPALSLWFAGQDFTAAGARRLQATFGYSNTAAMALEATAFVGIGLAGVARGRWIRLAIAAAVVLLTAATVLTLSRGSLLGLGAGVVALTALAVASQRRRLGLATLAGGATLLVGAALVQLWSAPAERFWTASESGLFDAAYRVPGAVVVAPEEEMRLTAVVTNTGEAAWNVGDSAGVRLGRHWLDPATHHVVSDEHEYSELGPLAPGAMTAVSALVRAPAHPGEYLLAWDAIQEPGIWLSERGVPVAITRVEVRTDPAGAGLPEAPAGEVVLYPDIPREPSRGELWRAAVAMVAERPALGVGPGTFRLRYGEYLGWQAWDERIHANNLYLELAATTGLLGLATFLFIVAYALACPLRNLIRPRGTASTSADAGWLLRAGLTAAVVAFLAHGVVDYFLGFNPTIGLFWAVLGIGLGLALERPDQTTGRSRAAKTETGA